MTCRLFTVGIEQPKLVYAIKISFRKFQYCVLSTFCSLQENFHQTFFEREKCSLKIKYG